MTVSGAQEFGDPCRECGYHWKQSFESLMASHSQIHSGLSAAVTERNYRTKIADTAWSVGEYVCHIADNEHIWAERLATAAEMAEPRIAAFEQDALAAP
ncbi:DinB family protein [Rhodococcus xishaensis]|uniref:DinB-like domain-containing protein n=1 Tax=Rhodococcus xishaensis TaxID=2487364 RepID=A0A438ARN3_9NOCA|nr:DinB family protein [Rhodococcus xishaensis]RVW01369.1 hypothetical protein EGT50_14280 [Rhodococcus xishaensis]